MRSVRIWFSFGCRVSEHVAEDGDDHRHEAGEQEGGQEAEPERQHDQHAGDREACPHADPQGGRALVVGVAAYILKLAVAGFLLALFETSIAKMRVFRVPEFLGAALMLGLLATLLRVGRSGRLRAGAGFGGAVVREVKHVKPPASRAESVELYLVASGFRGVSAT